MFKQYSAKESKPAEVVVTGLRILDSSTRDELRPTDTLPRDIDIVRKFGCLETYQLALQTLDYMRVNIVGYRYKLPVRWRLPGLRNDLMATCEEAVARVVLRHPHMHVGITGEHTRNPHWVRLRELDLNNHINWTFITPRETDYQKALGSVVGQELDTRFADYQNVPRWRLRILHQEGEDSIDILFSFCHIAVDGSSVKIFHRELLQSLRGGSEAAGEINVKDHILVLPEDSTTTFSPPAEDLVQFPVDLKALVYYWQNEVEISTAAYPKKPRQAHWAPIQTTPYKTQIRSIYIPGDALSKLIAACHHQKTTMTGLLHALAAVSLAPLLDPAEALEFEFLTAMDLRRFLPRKPTAYPLFEPEKAMSNYVTCLSHVFDEALVAQMRADSSLSVAVGDEGLFPPTALVETIWEAARKIRHEIANKVDMGLHNDMNGFAQAVTNWRTQLLEESQRPRRSSWVITNLGAFDDQPALDATTASTRYQTDRDSWSITRSSFYLCANVVSSAFGIAASSVKGGGLSINFSWQESAVKSSVGDSFVKNIEDWLLYTSQPQDGWPGLALNSSRFR